MHNVVPDSLYWSEAAYRALPTAFRNPVAQKTVASTWTGQVYCLTTDGADYNMSVSPNPYKGNWYDGTPHFGKDADVSTFTYAEGMFYILADDGQVSQMQAEYSKLGIGAGENVSRLNIYPLPVYMIDKCLNSAKQQNKRARYFLSLTSFFYPEIKGR